MDFAIETTLTTLSYRKTIELARSTGYQITLLYFWLNDVKLAVERVKIRVSEGGHNIPEDVIIRRYYKGIYNLIDVFINLCDDWIIADNSVKPYTIIATGKSSKRIEIRDSKKWIKLIELENGRS